MDVAYQLDAEWPRLAAGKIARTLPHWQHQQPDLRRFQSVRQLLAFLHSAPAEETDAPLLALLALAGGERVVARRRRRLGLPSCEGLAGRTVLQVLLPALKTQAERIAYPDQRRDEVWELQLFFAWEAICCYPLQPRCRRVAANLALQVLHDTTRGLDRPNDPDDDDDQDELGWLLPLDETRDDDELTSRDESVVQLDIETDLTGGADIIGEGLAAGVIDDRDAELILCTRIDGVRLRRLARAIGVNYGALLKRRQRAEEALRNLPHSHPDVRKRAVLDLVSSEGTFSRVHPESPNRPTAIDARTPRAA